VQGHLFIVYFFMCAWFNLSAMNSEQKDGVRYTTVDPALCNIVMVTILCLFMVLQEKASAAVFSVFNLLVAMPVVLVGISGILKSRDYYTNDPS
jgi:phosphatidylserine synthase